MRVAPPPVLKLGPCISWGCEGIRLGPRAIPQPTDAELAEFTEKIIRRAKEYGQMHYRNGREAKNGDIIVQLGGYGSGAQVVTLGVLHSAVPGNDHCNGNIAPIQNPVQSACLCDCLHVDDLAAILKEKGLDKRPAGK